MNSRFRGVPRLADVAKAYQSSATRLYEIRQKHNLSQADLMNPDIVFQTLLVNSRESRLRTRLSDPATRQTIREKLNP